MLFDLLSYHAWTLSPCHQNGVSGDQITVYTDPQTLPEDVIAGDATIGETSTNVYIPYNQDYEGDGVIDDVYWMLEGYVADAGSSVYSFTTPQDTNLYSVVHYWNGSTESKATDEEFE